MTAAEPRPVEAPRPWHAMEAPEVLRALEAEPGGLSEAEVERRRERFGRNVLPRREPPTLLQIVLHQLKSPLIYILLAAAAVAMAIGEVEDSGFILAVVVLNAALGAYQERRAEKSAAALQSMLRVMARVRRDGHDRTLDAEDLVPGDLVTVESGDKVPADARLIRAVNLGVDESFLTGESAAVSKRPETLAEAELPVGDRSNLVHAGSTVTTGRGTAVVVATGTSSELGRIAEATSKGAETKPPLVIRMERFVSVIGVVVLASVTLLAGVAFAQGTAPLEVFFMAVALAVSAIPEGLPVAITVALSIGVSRMAKRNVIVRKMTAVEGLGSCTFIASDKTGTLTVNRQTIQALLLPGGERFRVSGEGYSGRGEVSPENGAGAADERLRRLGRAAVLCNEGELEPAEGGGEWRHAGDAVDVAFLALGYKLGVDPPATRSEAELLGSIPFESERQYAAVAYRLGGELEVAVKGGVERVLELCDSAAAGAGTGPLDRAAVEAQAASLAEAGYRVLAVAAGRPDGLREGGELEERDLGRLTLLGLAGMADPLRPEAREAVATCRRAGVEVAMVTGDHPMTARALARELGILEADGQVVTGQELAGLEPGSPEHRDRVLGSRVFARVAPLQKLQLVETLREAGHFVAVTGDGVNDAPALRAANIGVAMGSGTDVTKDTASIIVTDDDFASIVHGIEEGRFAYANIRKVIYLLISTGAAEVLMFLLAVAVGAPLPLLAVQLLWLNLVTNGIQDVALAFEGGEPGVMRLPPRRPDEGIFNRQMVLQTAISGATMGAIAFGVWMYLLANGWGEAEARNLVLLLMVLFQNVHVFNCRSELASAFRVPISRNRVLVFGVAAALGIHLLAMHVPFFQGLLGTSAPSLVELVSLVPLALVVLLVMELFKLVRRRGVAPSAAAEPR